MAVRADGRNFDLYPVPVTFFTCTFTGKLPLGMQLIPRHVKYETESGPGRNSVSCISVSDSTRPEINRGDIVVRVNQTPLISNLPRDLNSTNLDEFFAECMTALAPTEGPRTLVFLRPMESTAVYITGMSKNLVLHLDAEAESNMSDFVMGPPQMTPPQEFRAPAMQQTSIPTTTSYPTTMPVPVYMPATKLAVESTRLAAEPPQVKKVYRSEEEEIEKKVQDEMRAIATALRVAKLKKDEEESRLKAQQEAERIAHLEFIRKETEDEERRVHELARAQEMMRIEGERRAAEAIRQAEEDARQKRVDEAVRRRVEEESQRLAEEQEVASLVEQELNRINEIKMKADHEARVERIAEEAKKRIQAEMERVVQMEEMQRIAVEEEAKRLEEAAQKRIDDMARYAENEAMRLERAAKFASQLHENKTAVVTEEIDESEMSEEAILKVAEKKARERRVAEEVNKRIVAEKERLLHQIEQQAADDENRASSAKKFDFAPATASVGEGSQEKGMSAEEKIRSDAVMESWLQTEVKKRVAEEVRRRIDSVKEHSYEAKASPTPYNSRAEPEQSYSKKSNAFLFDTLFPDRQPMGLVLMPHTVLFTNPEGEVKSICCCMVGSSAFTADIEQGDIAVSINHIPLMALATAKVSAASNFSQAMRTVQNTTISRTVRFFRAERPVSEDGSTSSLSYSEAFEMMQNQ
jgi:hypothetical protein